MSRHRDADETDVDTDADETTAAIEELKRKWFADRGIDIRTDDGKRIPNAKRSDIQGATGEQLDGLIWELDGEIYRVPASMERWAHATVQSPDDEGDDDADGSAVDHRTIEDPWRREQARREQEERDAWE